MSEIKTWFERIPFGADYMKEDYMQEEIDELRAALAADDDRFEWLQENVDSAITRSNIDIGMQATNQ